REVMRIRGETWNRRTRERELDSLGAKELLYRLRQSTGGGAVGGGILRVAGRRDERHPREIRIGIRVVVGIGRVNGRDRPPEVVIVLGVERGNERVRGASSPPFVRPVQTLATFTCRHRPPAWPTSLSARPTGRECSSWKWNAVAGFPAGLCLS